MCSIVLSEFLVHVLLTTPQGPEHISSCDLDFMIGHGNAIFAVPDAAINVIPVTLVVVPTQSQPQWE
ncbi:hypothetical protein D9611_008857 [Ephemerocybe angulata]|uniref:Uncharacterized protein n=1 Tax=Ephemerocybe angulata TaxID=980116 RepID=A0A8H5BYH4_9AGAR|nr:hypothetical protein D9611_008857 [Tulosesus angulatus]